MKKSGLQPAKNGCQVTSAVSRFVRSKGMYFSDRLVTYDGDYRSCDKVGYYLILHLGTNQFVGHDPLRLMSAAVVGEYHLGGTVLMKHVTLPVAAGSAFMVSAAVIPYRVNGQGCCCLISTAMETCVMNKGKAETTRQHERDQEE